jgi:nicotinamide-nucleotide amidase
VPKILLDKYSPESAEVTREMAVLLKKMMSADIVVAVTGLTTPGGSEGPGKPVGTMFYCILIGQSIIERRNVFSGSARRIVYQTIEHIVKTIIKSLRISNE